MCVHSGYASPRVEPVNRQRGLRTGRGDTDSSLNQHLVERCDTGLEPSADCHSCISV